MGSKQRKKKPLPNIPAKRQKTGKKLLKAILIMTASIVAAIALILLILGLIQPNASGSYEVIKFSELYNVTDDGKTVSEKIKSLDGQKVKMRGFMAEQSPIDESFIYLVNAPFTVCPFCVITDSTKLEVLTVYMANKSPVKYTTEPVEIVGKLEVEPKADKVFGEVTQFRIYADKVNILKDDGADKQVVAYFNQMNSNRVIALINIAYINIYDIVSTDLIDDTTISNEEKYELIKQRYYSEYITEGIYVLEEKLRLIKEMKPTNPRIKAINDELIKLFEDEIQILKDVNGIAPQIQNSESEEQIAQLLEKLKTLSEKNKLGFENFTKWNNLIRES